MVHAHVGCCLPQANFLIPLRYLIRSKWNSSVYYCTVLLLLILQFYSSAFSFLGGLDVRLELKSYAKLFFLLIVLICTLIKVNSTKIGMTMAYTNYLHLVQLTRLIFHVST